MKKGEIYEGVVERIDFPNKGRVHVEGETVTVKNAIPGQKIRFQINKKRKNRMEGRLLEVTEKSPMEKRDPVCSIFPSCGGCMYQTMSYEDQLAMKAGQVKKHLGYPVYGRTLGIIGLGAIGKGSGMIAPNMATMLGFLTTDAAVSPEMLQCAVKEAADVSFNMVSVDGDTSTNDTLAVLASGKAGNQEITEKSEDYQAFLEGLVFVCREISKLLAGDGEGATKLLICKVSGAKTLADAKGVAKSVICSSLLKAAMFGADANWGRVLCAIGYSGCDVDISKVDVAFRSAKGAVTVCVDGAGIEFSEEKAKEILLEKEIDILVDLKDGSFDAEAYGCDLTYDYVKINGDYRT